MKSQQENGLRNALNRRETLPPHPNAPQGYPIPRAPRPIPPQRDGEDRDAYLRRLVSVGRSEAARLSSGIGTSPVRTGKTARDRAGRKARP